MNTTKTWKRILSVLLALVLLLSVAPIGPYLDLETHAATATKKIYFQNNKGWSKFNIYYWGGSTSGVSWPGKTMTWHSKDNNFDIYYYEIPADATGMIFNDGSQQTVNIEGSSIVDGNCYYLSSDSSHYSVGSYAYNRKYYLVGDSAIAGSNWNTTDSNNVLTFTSNGVYTITKKNVPAGTYGIKVVQDGDYNNGQWPSSGNKSVTVSTLSDVTITFNLKTGAISYTTSAVTASYSVTLKPTNVNLTGNSTATTSEDYVATLTAVSGYTLPTSVEVTVGGNTLDSSSYTYSGGKVTIPKSKITGDITITASGVKEAATTYTVTYSLSNLTYTGATSATAGSDFSTTLKASSGYTLPSSVTVKVGSTTLSSGYTYDSSTGAITVSGSSVNGNITISASGVATSTDTWTIYLKPGSNWKESTPRFAVYYWPTGGNGTWVNMTAAEVNGVFTATIPANCTNVIFGRFSASDATNSFEKTWNRTGDLTVPYDGAMFVVGDDQWGDGNTGASGDWQKYSTTGGTSDDNTFYVNTDIVDYLNDYRVNSGAADGYSNDNQGIWMDTPDNPVFTYLNYIIAQQEGYTYPLYFGNLLFISNRYGVYYKPFTDYNTYDYNRDNGKENLTNWNTGANVAINYNNTYNAVVQGLVGDRLDEYGQLMDPKTEDKQLFYFDKTSIESWKTSDGTKRLAAYYSNLQFPFKTEYDPDTHVTTYSYDSSTDDAVFIDYDNYNEDNETNPMYTSSNYAKDQNNNKGFFPLNKPGESSNDSNYGFGVKFTIDFTVSSDGTIVAADGSETPVQFSFTGDDDVWVFIDGYLVLDMGGAHTKAQGTIDFQKLNATVKQAAQVSDKYTSPSFYYDKYGYQGDGENREGLSVSTDLATPFPTDLAAKFQTEYTTGISQVHTLTMFYMERGTIESNMSIEFSMSPIPSGLTVSKDIENVNPGLNAAVQDDDEFSFTIEATDKDDNEVTFDGYDLTDHNSITTGMTTTNNTITGIRGDRYAHNFTSGNLDAFTAGTTFKITEGAYDSSKYSGTRWVVYEYSNGYKQVAEGTSREANFTMKADSAGNYALNFINTLKAGTLTLSKTYMDTLIDASDMDFVFEVKLNLNNEGYKLFPGLTYDLYEGSTLKTADVVSSDGTVTLKAGQTAKIKGIPVGTLYQVTEIDNSALWEVDGDATVSGTMTASGAEVSFTNKTTSHALAVKVIYVEAGTNTSYTIKDGSNTINLNSVSSKDSGLSVNVSGGKAIVNGADPDAEYTFSYAGTYSDGSYVSGQVIVYTFAATDKVYVFDFGLSSNLAATNTNGDGLFQGGHFYNSNVSVDSVKLTSLSGIGNTQTTVSTTLNKSISTTGTYSYAVTFTPVAFMSKVETYEYTAQITAYGKTFVEGDPETGTIVTGTIKIMPANIVYYEDNFNAATSTTNAANKIIFSANAPTKNPTLTQSNDRSTNYGYDKAYLDGYTQSNDSSTTLTTGQYAYFTFTGSGFDLISHTSDSSAGIAVYVFSGTHSSSNITAINKYDGSKAQKLVFVDTYYNNGTLYQVPVANVRLGATDTYTVYVQALATSPSVTSISIDGVRIYDPLADTSLYPLAEEKNTTVDELRELYGAPRTSNTNGKVTLAGRGNRGVFNGLGKADAVYEAMLNASIIENMEGDDVISASDLENIFLHGPNNEMYLPTNFGVAFTYKVTSSNWTLQLGAKAVTASGTSKSFSVYARTSGKGSYTLVDTITLSSTTDMYYDLTDILGSYSSNGSSYDIIIISESAYATNEFVSLTTVKHSGITLV